MYKNDRMLISFIVEQIQFVACSLAFLLSCTFRGQAVFDFDDVDDDDDDDGEGRKR